jgi:hypothetical protein
MNNLGPGVLVHVHDPTKEPGSQVELGEGMHKFLAEDPEALPALAVDMIVCAIDKVAVDETEAVRLQWRILDAMTEKLRRFQRLDRASGASGSS